MKWFERATAALDRFQSRRSWTAVPVAVWRKFSDDQAGYLAALITYFGFVALFPLLLIFVTVLDITLKNHPALHHDLLNSALAQYPVIGDQINNNLGEVSGTGLQLGVGIGVLMLGTRGVAFAMQNALCNVWGISRTERPPLAKRWLYALALVITIGSGLVATSFLSGIAGGARMFLTSFGANLWALAISLTLNAGVFWLAFRLATVRKVPWRNLRFGAMLAAIVWQVLQVAGAYFLTHYLQRVSALYGAFGVVLGLLGWLYLQATVTLYCAEVDAVLTKRRWPRSLLTAEGAAPEGAIRPRGAILEEAMTTAIKAGLMTALPGKAASADAGPASTTPASTGPASTGPASTGPAKTEPGNAVPGIPVQAGKGEHARENRAEAAIGDGGRAGARQVDSREIGAAGRDASKDRARDARAGRDTPAA
jgi:YihY family inner membrane protein